MNLKLFLITGVLLCISCTNSEDLGLNDTDFEFSHNTQVRSPIEALDIANKIAAAEVDYTRASRKVSAFNIRPILADGTRSTASDTIMYAVNFEGGRGFALISTDRRIAPVLAIIDAGSYEDAENSENPEFQYAMKNIIQFASISPVPIIPNPAMIDTIYPRKKSEKILEVDWGQFWPENIYCPNGVAGCGPIATAQILSSFKKRVNLFYNFDEAGVLSEEIDWNSIISHTRSLQYKDPSVNVIEHHLNSCPSPIETHHTLARVVRQIGKLEDAVYESFVINGSLVQETSVQYDPVVETIKNLSGESPRYSGSGIHSLFEKIIGETHSIALVGSEITINGQSIGRHLWVADGAWEIGLKIRHEAPGVIEFPRQEPTTKIYFEGEIDTYLHCNWGWSGNCNGYFLTDALNPSAAYQYDYESGNSSQYDSATTNLRYSVYKTSITN